MFHLGVPKWVPGEKRGTNDKSIDRIYLIGDELGVRTIPDLCKRS